MKKQQYLAALMRQPLDWIKRSAAMPNAYMSPMDIALHHIAIRRKEIGCSAPVVR